VSVGLA
jgi:hypothetical protein